MKYCVKINVVYMFEMDEVPDDWCGLKEKAEDRFEKIMDSGLEGKYYHETVVDSIES